MILTKLFKAEFKGAYNLPFSVLLFPPHCYDNKMFKVIVKSCFFSIKITNMLYLPVLCSDFAQSSTDPYFLGPSSVLLAPLFC